MENQNNEPKKQSTDPNSCKYHSVKAENKSNHSMKNNKNQSKFENHNGAHI